MRENPSLLRAWNRFLQKQIADRVSGWAQENHVPEERWKATERQMGFDLPISKPVNQRTEIYDLLDRLPLEDLLQLRVPLEWMLKAMKR